MPHQLAISPSRQVGGPAPRRAPLPRRRVRRGCADPAPPAGPSGAAGSGQPLGTLRSPPRPRGGANRAGERVPPLFLLEPPGPVAQRTQRTFFGPTDPAPTWYTQGGHLGPLVVSNGSYVVFGYLGEARDYGC